MRLLSWNIRQGGGQRVAGIIEVIEQQQPDVLALQEFRHNGAGASIANAMNALGLGYQFAVATENTAQNTLWLASRYPFDAGEFMPDAIRPPPLIEAFFPDFGGLGEVTLLVAHLPHKQAQLPIFQQLLDDSDSLLSLETLLVGDLNCGIPLQDSMTQSFVNTRYFQQMLATGWVDCWRSRNPEARDYSWYSTPRRHGYRYDHALASAGLAARVGRIHYLHAPREAGLSDHSALWLELT